MPSSNTQVPIHIGLIMDGNGRWARNKNKPRTYGHSEGLKVAKRVIKRASELGIKFVTLYTFSTENWKRTQEEVGFLLQLIHTHLKKEMDFYRKNQIRVKLAGDPAPLPSNLQKEITDVIQDTAHFTGLTVVLAINYGGRDEIIRGIKRATENAETEITEENLSLYLDNPEVPDPDLIIRTAGEERLSNFLLWEVAYSEFYFTDILWPEFNEDELEKAIEIYNKRTRKFGGIK